VEFWGRNELNELLQNILDADARLCGGKHNVCCVNSNRLLNLSFYSLRFCCRKVDLVEDWNYLEVILQRKVDVCQRLHF
jgi:hypothetical protein